jgi:hypothetical protein
LTTLIEDLAAQTGLPPATVEDILGRVFAHIHRRFYEGEPVPINGDYVGEGLHWDIGAEAYFHFIGILAWLARNNAYQESGEVIEYALRGLSPEDRERFQAQMDNWKPRVGFE